jgi:ferredoxin-NADP reductase
MPKLMPIFDRFRQAPPSASGRSRHDPLIGLADATVAGLFGLSGAIRKMSPAAVLDRSIPLNVVDRQVVARDQDVVALTLAPVDGHRLPRWHPGAHLDLHLPSGRVRQYSLCGDPDDTDTYLIAVRGIIDGGGGSVEVHDGLAAGAGVTTHGPRNAFPLTVPGYGSPTQRYRFIAGGIGVTPILPMLGLAQRLGVDWSMVYAGRSIDSLPFTEEVARFGDRVEIRTDDVSGVPTAEELLGDCPDATTVYARARADADRDPREAGRTRRRRAAFRTLRCPTGRRRPRVLGVDRVVWPNGTRRLRRYTVDRVAPLGRRGALFVPARLLRHVPNTGGGGRRRPSRHAADRSGARRRHHAGLHLASQRRASHPGSVARLYYSAIPLADGQTFAGYTIVRLLGSGGMGEVYLADHPRLPRADALKVLPADVSADSEYRQRFNREADIAATLWHPHIVGVHDRGDFEGQIWISMDYVEGTDAAQLLRDRYPNGMPKEDVLAIVTAVGEALDYAHSRNLLHRDVKPANIMLAYPESGEQRVLLCDFGIARRVDDSSGLTATNMTVGTVYYAAPEQLMGDDLDGRADQYALAATASPADRLAAVSAFQSHGGHQPTPHRDTARDRRQASSCRRSIR